MGCKKAQGFLEQNELAIGEATDASKVRKARAEALKLARSVERVVVGKGKKVQVLDMKKSPPGDEELAALLLGPSGNLKAPTLRIGQTLLVGYNEEAYRQVLGANP
jgi:arsenate reductase-like glutaredoxin family protein